MPRESVPGMPGYEADIVMRSLTYDAVRVQQGVTYYKLFSDSDDVADVSYRYNNECETNVIQWLLTNAFDVNMGLTRGELNIGTSYTFYAEVKKPIIIDREIPGDIDLLAIDDKHPNHSIAFQVKRVKARILETGKAEIFTKHIYKAVEQARQMMYKCQFHRNYLMLVLVADTQYHQHDLQLFRNLSFEEKQSVYCHPAFDNLTEDVGLYIYELYQPSKNPVGQTATIAVKQHRKAKVFEQLVTTTEKIIEFLKM